MLDYTDYDTRLAGYALVRDDAGRVLLSRWIGPDSPAWTCPGGGIEFGEQIVDGITRELLEETGYHVEVGRLLGVRTFEVDAEERLAGGHRPLRIIQVFHEARTVGGELTFETDGSSDMAGWFTLEEISNLPHVSTVDHLLGLLGRITHA
ncbi:MULTISPECIES: NUDIX hydrolase [unclassified Luteococcus]|uniref:NUDIX hydrolase n=1 Tax=unclassified Luteococcus TaxID=2639923 RepID=UPI00313C80BB